MPSYTYTGDEERYYPQLGLTVSPGDSAELDECPTDGRWGTPFAPPAVPPTTTTDE